jgi:hypothetical protein
MWFPLLLPGFLLDYEQIEESCCAITSWQTHQFAFRVRLLELSGLAYNLMSASAKLHCAFSSRL